ncbi:hypothetical protein NIES25_70210 (plasmid) [Nostoc linckia NIES-25]|nr:hypothetical protein NIES25_70210 [Nostoc linckia NIES-25]
MTNSQPENNRLDRIEAILERVVVQQETTANSLAELTYKVDDFIETSNRVIARSAVLDDVVLELRESSERNQRNFEEHQRTTNAALQSLEAILLQLIRNFS